MKDFALPYQKVLGFPQYLSGLHCFNTLCHVLQDEVAELLECVSELHLRVAKLPRL